MPITPRDPAEPPAGPDPAAATLANGVCAAPLLARGVCRLLEELGFATLTEFTLRSGRRVDVIGLDGAGQVLVVEIKTSVEDFRSDQKWPEYLDFCDLFYFAVPERFPRALVPEDSGLMIADAYGAVALRPAPLRKLNGSRRRAQTLRFGLAAAQRLTRLTDPR